jgi:hypothetical protein
MPANVKHFICCFLANIATHQLIVATKQELKHEDVRKWQIK